LNGATFASPGAIGSTTAGSAAHTTISATGIITSTVSTGTAPFTVSSTTVVGNLNVSFLNGGTFASPTSIGSTTPNSGAFSTLSASGVVTISNATALGGTSNPTTATGGSLLMSGDTVLDGSSQLYWASNQTTTLPSFTTRSSGSKLVLYPSTSSTSVDYSIGIGSNVFWSSVPQSSSGYSFQWFGGTTSIMTLDGTGNLTVTNSQTIQCTTDSSSSTSGALIVSGGVGIAKSLFVNGSAKITGTTSGGNQVALEIFNSSGLTSSGTLVDIFGLGSATNITNYELMQLAWDSVNLFYRITTGSQGTGINRALSLSSSSQFTQLMLNTDGSSSFGITTDSSSSTTGALIVSGGVGIAKSLIVGGQLVAGYPSGLVIQRVDGNIGNLSIVCNASSNLVITNSTSTNGTIILNGGSLGGNLFTFNGSGNSSIVQLTLSNTTDSSSSTTGSLVVSGGVGIAKNLSVSNVITGYTTTVTSASTVTLTVSSTQQQFFTGSTAQTLVLPVTSTLALGFTFSIVNLSTQSISVQSSGTNAVVTVTTNTRKTVTCILTSGTTAASWTAI
jgi:hypothetical protein